MADRRMLTKKITDDDHFMSLSSSAQALYLHLTMSADDDGFCNQISASMFKSHSSTTDLESLINAKYIIQFESGVICIKHWRMANSLRKDRYTPTAFQEEFSQLYINENGAYSLHNDAWLPNGCQMVANWLPQDRLDKDSLDKDRLDESNREPIRNKYGEHHNVELTEDELARLKAECPLWKDYIERLSSYMASHKKNYADHLETMLSWYKQDEAKKPKISQHSTASYDLAKFTEKAIYDKLECKKRRAQ